MAPDELAQLAEVARVLGVAKRTAAKYVDLPGFPEPLERLSTGRVWRRADVLAWGREHLGKDKQGRPSLRVGRPPKRDQ